MCALPIWTREAPEGHSSKPQPQRSGRKIRRASKFTIDRRTSEMTSNHEAKLPATASDLKIAIGYVRAAEPQRDSQSGLTPQTEQVRAIAGANGIDLVEVIADTGQTGLTLKRPGLQRLLAAIEAGVIGTVVVSELSRLTRSRSDQQSLLNLFDRCGVALILGTETFDSEGAEMIFTVVAYEVTKLTRTVEAESVEEAIALAYHGPDTDRSEEHTSELQSLRHLVC